MNCKQRVFIGLIGGMISSSTLAELPDHSILTRYGVTSDLLPAAEEGNPVDAASYLPRFKMQTPKSWVSVGVEDTEKPHVSGNISIDRSAQQEHGRCLRFHEQSLRRKGEGISCDEGGLALEVSLDHFR
ncbi:hypothetical protein SAMN03159382_04143 [Pseudomonas sp. NFACC23-1]|uniref:hypothetical protein n=1 Tax=unclassified Pseudomonas TaxID=196821 RepID=UPI0008847A35|nr:MULTISPECIES: hypothetical protein [unclassified Pseudomonas]SDB54830.1 hypothetical protein SAMN03159386_04212 [Pseudomonas sp. NFACC17-2]SEJ74899.1 hypothetical protein SAMN03159382_04143 [Pseudomonas sp. NFACC23-1]SFW86873.1 hypothetical protein SAMN05660640_04597 [Pseudomonas sp. NFACC16-2]